MGRRHLLQRAQRRGHGIIRRRLRRGHAPLDGVFCADPDPEARALLLLPDILRVLVPGEGEQATYQIGGGHPLRALDDPQTPALAHLVVGADALGVDRHVVAVDTEVSPAVLQSGYLGGVGHVVGDLVDPLDVLEEGVSLGLPHDRYRLVLLDLRIRVHPNDENVTQALRLADGVVVPRVHDVPTSVDIAARGPGLAIGRRRHPPRRPRARARRAGRGRPRRG
mmetsp:Transcript_6738/g.18230  ORF Transcript_6738/g.18230 Transcript_6738/m.18230 type:complete len:223 (+) Transcript_6738:902-1570(+)